MVNRISLLKSVLSIVALLVFFASTATAQFFRIGSRPVQPEIAIWEMLGNQSAKQVENRLYYKSYGVLGDYSGTPYVLDSLSTARVVDSKGDIYEVRYFNVDAYSDEFIVSKTNNLADEDYIWLNKKEIDFVIVANTSGNDKSKRYFKNIEFIDEPLGICEVLFNNEEIGIQVYRKHNRKFTDAIQGTNIIADRPPRFGKSEYIYVFKVKEGLVRVKNEKAFVKLFGENKKKVKKLIKEMKLDYRNPDHLINIFLAFPNLSLI